MIHHNILHEIKKHRQHESFIYPYYGKYSIAEIPPTVLSFFNVPTDRPALPFREFHDIKGNYSQLLLFFVDGFGFEHFVDYEKSLPFFSKIKQKGNVFPLTSVFPSTTAAALTAFHTGLTPQEHGLPEWTVYFEELDRISFGSLIEKEGQPDMLYSGRTVYETLRDHGINSYVFTYAAYIPSSYSSVTQKGATSVTFTDLDDLIEKLVATMNNEKGQAYYFVYWGAVDGIEHTYGPRSKEHVDALAALSERLNEKFTTMLDPAAVEDVLFVLASDHGQANIRNEDIIYLNNYINLEENYLKTPSKKTIYPTGAPHDIFLHVHESKIASTIEYLSKVLEGKASVITTKEALERGLFGLHTPSSRFLKRIGDVLILPYEGYHVWYQHTPNARWKQLGIHGGLSQQEMLVPFGFSGLSDLL